MAQEHKMESPTEFGEEGRVCSTDVTLQRQEQGGFFMHTQDTEQTHVRDSLAQDVSRETWVKRGSGKLGAEGDSSKSACITAAL